MDAMDRIEELEDVLRIIIRKSHYAEDGDALKALEAIHDLATEVMVGDVQTGDITSED